MDIASVAGDGFPEESQIKKAERDAIAKLSSAALA
jgi:hypothetical protein